MAYIPALWILWVFEEFSPSVPEEPQVTTSRCDTENRDWIPGAKEMMI
jgi:hypothetical protein